MESRFSKQADLYVRYRPTYPKELYDFILDKVRNSENAWDCGTGSGQVARVLANHFDRVYASDISRQQLEQAPDIENVHYFQVPAEDTGFPSSTFNLITVAQAIHWFDFEGFYSEAVRTARKDALLAVIGYGICRIDSEINDLIKNFYDEMFGQYFGENRKYLDEEYQTIPFPFEEIPSPNFKKELNWNLSDFEGFVNSWSTVQRYKDDYGSNPADILMERISAYWKQEEAKTVTFPIFLRLGRVHSSDSETLK